MGKEKGFYLNFGHANQILPLLLSVVAIGLFFVVSPARNAAAASGTVTDCSNGQQLQQFVTNGGSINFNCGSGAHTITLTSTLIVANNVSIDGGSNITLSGGGFVRLFQVNGGVSLTLQNITLTNGVVFNFHGSLISLNDGPGGALYNNGGSVTISNSIFYSNTVINHAQQSGDGYDGQGGAIYNIGTLNLYNTNFISNTVNGGNAVNNNTNNGTGGYAEGGAIYNANNGTLTITGGSFSKNQVNGGSGAPANVNSNIAGTGGNGQGGAIANYGTFSVNGATFDSNTALAGAGAKNISGAGVVGGFAYGGSIYSRSQQTSNITNTTFTNSTSIGGAGGNATSNDQAGGDGGGAYGGSIYQIGGNISIADSKFFIGITQGGKSGTSMGYISLGEGPRGGNSTGGAIFNDTNSTLLINNSTIGSKTNFNAAYPGLPADSNAEDGFNYGGGIYNIGSLTLNNSQVIGNRAVNSNGGGIESSGNLTVTNSLFDSNIGGDGAGLFSSDSSLLVNNSTFSNNAASGDGSGLYSNQYFQVNNSSFISNTSTGCGGGIYAEIQNTTGVSSVSNSTIAYNSAPNAAQSSCAVGLEAYNQYGQNFQLINSTVANNNGLNIGAHNGTVLTTTNTIVVNPANVPNCAGGVVDGGYNLEYAGGGLTNDCNFTQHPAGGNPLLGPLQNNGGPTLTMALQAGSPAIDAGNDTVCQAAPVNNRDQRGAIRPSGAHCDIGAYEYAASYATAITAKSGSGQNTAVNTTFANPLQALVTDNNNAPISNTAVTFSAPTTGASCTFNGSPLITVNTDANGIATSPSCTANNTAGSYTVTATVSGVATPAYFTLTNNAVSSGNNYQYNLPFLAQAANNFTTYLAFQNASNNTATITIQYFDATGGNLATPTGTCTTLAPHAECIAPNPLANGNQGTGIITSNQPLNVIVSEATPYGGSAYAVSQGANNNQVAPVIIRGGLGDFTTKLTIFNAGSSAVAGSVQFYQQDGTLVSAATKNFTLNADTSLSYDQATDTNLGSNFYGWAQISSSSNSQLVAQVLEQSPSQHFVALANTQATAQSTLYAPAIFRDAYGAFNTGVNIVNPNAQAVNVTVTYYNKDGSTYTAPSFPLAAHALQGIYQGATSGAGLPSGGLVDNFAGAAIVTSSGGSVVMAVNEFGGVNANGNAKSGTYSASATSGNSVGLPVIANGGFGYTTGATIFNTSGQMVSGSIQYYNTDGSAQGTAKSFSVGAHQSVALFQGDSSQGLPGGNNGFYGTAVVTESGGGSDLIITTNAASSAFFYSYTEPNS